MIFAIFCHFLTYSRAYGKEKTSQVHYEAQGGHYSAPRCFIERLVGESVLRRDGIVLFRFRRVAAADTSLRSSRRN
jgi:hypothetical protein